MKTLLKDLNHLVMNRSEFRQSTQSNIEIKYNQENSGKTFGSRKFSAGPLKINCTCTVHYFGGKKLRQGWQECILRVQRIILGEILFLEKMICFRTQQKVSDSEWQVGSVVRKAIYVVRGTFLGLRRREHVQRKLAKHGKIYILQHRMIFPP